MRETPKSFDWVKARSSCSLKAVFEVLSQVIASDVKSANDLNRPGVSFALTNPAEDQLMVARSGDADGGTEPPAVLFELRANEIVATLPHRGKTLFYAKPVLDGTGECLLEIEGDHELKHPWQVSRKALDDLFFGS